MVRAKCGRARAPDYGTLANFFESLTGSAAGLNTVSSIACVVTCPQLKGRNTGVHLMLSEVDKRTYGALPITKAAF
jgi:hypothetical protein